MFIIGRRGKLLRAGTVHDVTFHGREAVVPLKQGNSTQYLLLSIEEARKIQRELNHVIAIMEMAKETHGPETK